MKSHDVDVHGLNLTDLQKKEFKKLDLAFEKQSLPTRNELDVKRLELEVELEEENPDIKVINGLIDAIHDLEAKVEKLQIATELQKRDLLSDEQRKDWKPNRLHRGKEIIMFRGDAHHDMMLGSDEEEIIIEKEVEIK